MSQFTILAKTTTDTTTKLTTKPFTTVASRKKKLKTV